MKRNGTKRQSPSVERQLALALIAVIESAKDLNGNGDREISVRQAAAAGQELLNASGYKDLESIPTRVKRIEAEIDEALKAQDGARLTQLGAMLDRAKKGLTPLATKKKTPQAPKTRKAHKKKDTGTGDLVLRDDAKLESLTENDGEAEWLTRHPEPKES